MKSSCKPYPPPTLPSTSIKVHTKSVQIRFPKFHTFQSVGSIGLPAAYTTPYRREKEKRARNKTEIGNNSDTKKTLQRCDDIKEITS
jgi:hypothetical protein